MFLMNEYRNSLFDISWREADAQSCHVIWKLWGKESTRHISNRL